MADRTGSAATEREQRLGERRRQILDAARERADADGWAAVTTRHLAEAIGFSQPVLYGHFPGGKAEIVQVVALDGFEELARRCRAAAGRVRGRGAVVAVADAYLDFADEHPAVYEAMFQQPVGVQFAAEDSAESEPALRAGFEVLADTIGDEGAGISTELFWGALHGISQLERAARMRPEHRSRRVAELAARFGR